MANRRHSPIPGFDEYPYRCDGIKYAGGSKVKLVNCTVQTPAGQPYIPEKDYVFEDVADVRTMRTGFKENPEYERVSIYELVKHHAGDMMRPVDVPSGRVPEVKPLERIHGMKRELTKLFFCRVDGRNIDCDTHWDVYVPY
jgi:hypothetical protein